MRTISAFFASQEAADQAIEALEAAGVDSGEISTEIPDGSSEVMLSARIENAAADAAHAIIQQAGARSVEETETGFDANGELPLDGDVESEEAARLRDPVIPVVAPFPR